MFVTDLSIGSDSSSSLSHGEIDMDQSELADSWTERSGPVSEDRSSHTYHAPHDISDFLSSNLDLGMKYNVRKRQ